MRDKYVSFHTILLSRCSEETDVCLHKYIDSSVLFCRMSPEQLCPLTVHLSSHCGFVKANNRAVLYMHPPHTAALCDCVCALYTAFSGGVFLLACLSIPIHTHLLSDIFPVVTALLKRKLLSRRVSMLVCDLSTMKHKGLFVNRRMRISHKTRSK